MIYGAIECGATEGLSANAPRDRDASNK